MTSTIPSDQLLLPGQTHVAQGPHDMTGMYVMHHAFRRDLRRFVAAVSSTPVEAGTTWKALAERWAKYETVLHHHHTIEDEHLWPVLAGHATEAADVATVEAMEVEHGVIAPILSAVSAGFREMRDHASEDAWRTLADHIIELRIALDDHLRHEETDALPMVQRTMSAQEREDAEKQAGKGYPARLMPFLVPWVLDDLSPDGRRRMVALAGRPYLVLHWLTKGAYVRKDAVAFRYV